MTARPELTAELKRLVLAVEDDLRTRLEQETSVKAAWQDEHRRALSAQRTGSVWETFRDDKLTQVAVSWVLTTVFVRFCEDNNLVAKVWISGPGAKRQHALDAELAFFATYPEQTAREWLLQAVRHLRALPATAGLVDDHTPLWQLKPSGDMAGRILAFWRETDAEGTPLRDLSDPELSTRFLGDLYQDLSEHAKKTYALLQTPVFVEEFILDQTLEPALVERPLEGFRLIDPTCGSGHFLLGAFDRFLGRWADKAPELSVDERVRRALDSVNGVDKNPFAVAIARFRLTVAAMKALGLMSLEGAPALDLQLAAGDSLLPWNQDTLDPGAEDDEHLFSLAAEDGTRLHALLQLGSYDVVVGNPPYITVKDKVENEIYRSLYSTCHRKYALSVPFMERFFQLAKGHSGPAGWVGQITSNSFMKREFGSKLIEQFLVKKDLQLVADTSGAYIPGHGTPTVIIVSRAQAPSGPTVRAVMGSRGEPGQPTNPADGLVWQEIVQHVHTPFEGTYVSVVDLPTTALSSHPWSLSGGGADRLGSVIEERSRAGLGTQVHRIGFFGIMGADDAMLIHSSVPARLGLEAEATRQLVIGENVRDYGINSTQAAWFPYSDSHDLITPTKWPAWLMLLWRVRTELGMRATFGGGTFLSHRQSPYEWHQLPKDRGAHHWAIPFAFVATHNHFVLDRGGKVFKQSAPVIKLPADATEGDHLELLGVLNSSTACFWLRQNSHPKTAAGMGGGMIDQPWSWNHEFTGTTLKDFPLPDGRSLDRARQLDEFAQQRGALLYRALADTPTASSLQQAETRFEELVLASIALQEELDWEVYGRYGLLDDPPLTAEPPLIRLGERAFEIVLAHKVADGTEDTAWFDRHHSTPITEIPAHWPAAYREIVQCRIDLIESDKFINLLERPEYKRRWATEPWAKQQERALRRWILDRLEDRAYWFDRDGRPQARSIAHLADDVSRDTDLLGVIRLWEGRRDVPVSESLSKLMLGEAVPYLAAYRLKETGMRKYAAWQRTWDLQRREDAGEDVGTIPAPPKYTSADFRKPAWWQARGKLDVPKERFILYPDANRAGDPSVLLGWAGWNHLQQTLALGTILNARADEGVETKRLVPLVAGLAELQPWVQQWHGGYDAELGTDMAQFTADLLRDSALEVGCTMDQLAAWLPAPPTRGRRPT